MKQNKFQKLEKKLDFRISSTMLTTYCCPLKTRFEQHEFYVINDKLSESRKKLKWEIFKIPDNSCRYFRDDGFPRINCNSLSGISVSIQLIRWGIHGYN